MFRIAALPLLPIHRAQTFSTARTKDTAMDHAVATRPASANIRIRRFESSNVSEETYTAILPQPGETPIDLMRIITEACKDLPEFQIRNKDDEQFILTLTLKG